MLVRRTIRLRIQPDAKQAERFETTRKHYAAAFNAVVDVGWEARRVNAVELHHATYAGLRKQLSLPSQLVITARNKAVESIKSAKKLEGNKPVMQNPSIRFDARCWRMDWNTCTARLTVIGGRIELPFSIDSYTAQFWGDKTSTAELVKRGKHWYLHVVIETEVTEAVSTGHVVGVDRGIKRPAVTSDGLFLGDRRWKDIEDRKLALRRRLQAKGTKSAKRHLRRLKDRLARFRRDCDHVLSKQLVASCKPGDTLVFEDLRHIRARVRVRGRQARRRLHAWSFARLGGFAGYKAPLAGVYTDAEDAHYTSQRCPSCGHIAKANRHNQSHFRCVRCGFARNADLVAAWNIRDRYEGRWSLVSNVPGPVNAPNVEGAIHVPSASPGL
jgi:IS605 OrfB family transposase